MQKVLLVPGINNSGPDHWQSRWEAVHPMVERVMQRDWDRPRCSEWVDAIETAVSAEHEAPILVAHSLGCLAVAHWMMCTRLMVRGAVMVAVPDPSGRNFPPEATGFKPLPMTWNGTRPLIVSSDDDPYASEAYTLEQVRAWRAVHVRLGAKGHINGASGLGDWDGGWQLVDRLRLPDPVP